MNKIILNKIDTLIEEFKPLNVIPQVEGYRAGQSVGQPLAGALLGQGFIKGMDKNTNLKNTYTKENVLRNSVLGGATGAGAVFAGNLNAAHLINEKLPPDKINTIRELSQELKPGDTDYDGVQDIINVLDNPSEYAFNNMIDNPMDAALATSGGAAAFAATGPLFSYGLGKLSGAIKNKLATQKK